MAASKAVAKKTENVQIIQITTEAVEFAIVGLSPLICNAMSEKAKQELLLPSRRKNMAERASTLKHDVEKEYRSSVYANSGPTLIGIKTTAFKSALRDVAVDIPGASKAQVGRLTYIDGEFIPVYGIPKLFMTNVIQGNIARTPDIRTRAILPRWACKFMVGYHQPLIKKADVVNLLAAAGVINGVGDGRQQKGALSYGRFQIVDPKDKEYLDIIRTGGREAQVKAMENPEDWGEETRNLRAWYNEEVLRREMKAPEYKLSNKPLRKGNGKGQEARS